MNRLEGDENMLKIIDKVNVPMEELRFITKDARIKFFKNLLANFEVFCPAFKRIYAYLNFNSETPVDYLVIFTAEIHGVETALWLMPYLYTSRTLPGYRYVVQHNLYEDFFKDCYMHMIKIPKNKFDEFIVDGCNLSLKKEDPNYWKNPEHGNLLLKNMASMSLLYNPVG